jgi:acyl carrier protein
MRRAYAAQRGAVDRGIPAAIVDVLCTQLGVEESALTLDAVLTEDLGADLLDLAEVQLELEVLYDVSAEDVWFDDNTVPQLTVGQIVRDLRKLGAKL